MGKRWIVLVNKTPRGPLSTEEISALVAQNLIRRNDLAYEVPEDPSSGTAEWKFLWQFPDFDRRKDEKLPSDPALLTEAQRNRRATPSERQIKAEVQAALPDEFATIQPEDLVLRAKPAKSFEALDKDLDERTEAEFLQPSAAPANSNLSWLVVGFLLCVGTAGFVFYKKQVGHRVSERVSHMELPTMRTPAEIEPPPPPPPPPSPGGKGSPGVVTSVIMREVPRPPEKGEISLEDYRKQREEKLEKERIEEEERRKAELKAQEEEGEDEAQSEEGAPKRKKIKKRKISAAEHDEGAEREPEKEPDAENEAAP